MGSLRQGRAIPFDMSGLQYSKLKRSWDLKPQAIESKSHRFFFARDSKQMIAAFDASKQSFAVKGSDYLTIKPPLAAYGAHPELYSEINDSTVAGPRFKVKDEYADKIDLLNDAKKRVRNSGPSLPDFDPWKGSKVNEVLRGHWRSFSIAASLLSIAINTAAIAHNLSLADSSPCPELPKAVNELIVLSEKIDLVRTDLLKSKMDVVSLLPDE